MLPFYLEGSLIMAECFHWVFFVVLILLFQERPIY